MAVINQVRVGIYSVTIVITGVIGANPLMIVISSPWLKSLKYAPRRLTVEPVVIVTDTPRTNAPKAPVSILVASETNPIP